MAGFTTVRPLTFLWTTAVGIIPGSFVYAYIGYAGQAVFENGIFTPEILIALGLLALISLLPVALKKMRAARRAAAEREEGRSDELHP